MLNDSSDCGSSSASASTEDGRRGVGVGERDGLRQAGKDVPMRPSSSLPSTAGTTATANHTTDLSLLFKTSARSVAQLYREALQQHQLGYTQALRDIHQFCIHHYNDTANSATATTANDSPTIPLELLFQFLNERYAQQSNNQPPPSASPPVIPASVSPAPTNTNNNNNQHIGYQILPHLTSTVDQDRWRQDMAYNSQLISKALDVVMMDEQNSTGAYNASQSTAPPLSTAYHSASASTLPPSSKRYRPQLPKRMFDE